MSLEDLNARIERTVKKRLPAAFKPSPEMFTPVMRELSDRVVEEALKTCSDLRTKRMDKAEVLKAVEDRLAVIELDLKVLSGESPPSYKQAKDGLIHLALPRGSSPCGWQWQKMAGRIVLHSEYVEGLKRTDVVCNRCRS